MFPHAADRVAAVCVARVKAPPGGHGHIQPPLIPANRVTMATITVTIAMATKSLQNTFRLTR